jgi:hypothetical protein
MFRAIFTLLGVFMLGTLSFFYFEVRNEESDTLKAGKITTDSPPCLQMHYFIEKYADEYGIPKNYAYGIAWKETRYNGPFHWDYNPKQTSYVGALGPMQIMPATARMMWKGTDITKEQLKSDIELNVRTSMKLLRYLHGRYNNWKLVFGAYNTGRPMVNQYAIDVYNYKIK